MSSSVDIASGRPPVWLLLVSLLLLFVIPVGCQPSAPSNSATSPTTAPGSNSAPPAASAPSTTSQVPPELAQKVEELIRLNDEYCTLAQKVSDLATFREHADELSRLDQESSSVTEDIMIAENKLSPTQRETLNREFFTPRAKPSIDRRRQEKDRIMAYLQ